MEEATKKLKIQEKDSTKIIDGIPEGVPKIGEVYTKTTYSNINKKESKGK